MFPNGGIAFVSRLRAWARFTTGSEQEGDAKSNLGRGVFYMKEMNSNNNNLGGSHMKKKVALLAGLMLAFAAIVPTTALAAWVGWAETPGVPMSINEGSPMGRESGDWGGTVGYLIWSSDDTTDNAGSKSATDQLYVGQQGKLLSNGLVPEQALGPHGNYATNTIKCATCHSVHLAPEDSWLLTEVTDGSGSANTAEVCALCHNALSGVSDLRVSVGVNGISGNHTAAGCSSTEAGRACHGGVHGAGMSSYTTLASKLLNVGADTYVANALGVDQAHTGLTADYFDVASAVPAVDKQSFAISYTCAMCHQGSAFATLDGMAMKLEDAGNHKTLSDDGPLSGTKAGFFSSHPMLSTNATASSDWSEAGASFSGQIAYAPAVGCVSCHSKTDPYTGNAMFPHATWTGSTGDFTALTGDDKNIPGGADAQGIWLETASSAASTAVAVSVWDATWAMPAATGYTGANGIHFGSAQDGVCLNCHRGTDTTGVGFDF